MNPEAYGLFQTILMVVVAPLVTAACTVFLKRNATKEAKSVNEKSEEHKEIILKETKAAFTEANDLNAKMLKVLERLEAVEKRQDAK